ncbi:MAG: hypothetical protein E6G90_14655 [Alphaproteobacteria bacterium]|nr:MAG: hypothetical protein E6G90_14655 [Alphaproteobacteria bacterium]
MILRRRQSSPPCIEPALLTADRASRNASLTLGLTLPTDTVLYLLLPLFPEASASHWQRSMLWRATRISREGPRVCRLPAGAKRIRTAGPPLVAWLSAS